MEPAEIKRMPETVSRSVFCEATGLPPRTVARMRARGEIRAIRIGSRHRYLRSEIARLVGVGYQGPDVSPRTPPAPALVRSKV
jgi:hypothetical protein